MLCCVKQAARKALRYSLLYRNIPLCSSRAALNRSRVSRQDYLRLYTNAASFKVIGKLVVSCKVWPFLVEEVDISRFELGTKDDGKNTITSGLES